LEKYSGYRYFNAVECLCTALVCSSASGSLVHLISCARLPYCIFYCTLNKVLSF
ncbi:hypothetical protein BDP27DRAFT_1451598, partial [Rhodocollybia butyracea]